MNNKFFSIEKCNKNERRKIQLYTLCLIIIGYLLIRYSPSTYFFHTLGYVHSNGCPLFTLTGIPCPTCGLGRSLAVIIDLQFDKYFYYNPSGPVLFIIFFILIIFVLILSFFNYRIKLYPKFYGLWYVFIIVTVIVWVLNIMFGHIER